MKFAAVDIRDVRSPTAEEADGADHIVTGNGGAKHAGSPSRVPARSVDRTRTIWIWIALGMIVAVAAFLRLFALSRVGFNSDEAVYSGQAASIAGSTQHLKYFPIYRAHPLLYQTVVAIVYHFVVSDFSARLVSVLFGLGTVVVTYHVGAALYGRRAGLIGAALLATMPYHVIVSRQVLLDGPETFFTTVALYALIRYRRSGQRPWFFALATALGLAFLTKETAAVVVVAVFVYLVLDPEIRVPTRTLLFAGLLFGGMAFVYPLAIKFGAASSNGKNFLVWQLLRPSNHGASFYPAEVFTAIGILIFVAAVVAVVRARSRWSWRETLLLSWLVVPVAFFELWPVKGYEYLTPVAPAVAVLAASALVPGRRVASSRSRIVVWSVVLSLVLLSLAVPSWRDITDTSGDGFLAGSGGTPGAREAAHWIARNLPQDAQILTLGPSMANVLEFYGDRKAWGLAVSANPQNRNPVYQPVKNPDLVIRQGGIQYLVWDTYSAHHSASTGTRLLRYAQKYHGRLIHSETVHGQRSPAILVYEVRP